MIQGLCFLFTAETPEPRIITWYIADTPETYAKLGERKDQEHLNFDALERDVSINKREKLKQI